METPPGTLPRGDDRVWRLRRAIYGLRQADHLFHQLVDEELTKAGAVRSHADECFYILRRGDEWVQLATSMSLLLRATVRLFTM